MLCRKCERNQTTGENRICDECVSPNTRRKRNPLNLPPGLARGTRWQYKRIPEVIGIIESIFPGGWIHCLVDDELGEFLWKSSIDHFLQAWEKIEAKSELDNEVRKHVEQTRRIPLPGQKAMSWGIPENEFDKNSRSDHI